METLTPIKAIKGQMQRMHWRELKRNSRVSAIKLPLAQIQNGQESKSLRHRQFKWVLCKKTTD